MKSWPEATCFRTTSSVWKMHLLENMREETWRRTTTLLGCYLAKTTTVMSPISTRFWKLIVARLLYDHFDVRVGNWETLPITCKERVKFLFPKNAYQLREILFEKLDPFALLYTDEEKLKRFMAVFNFASNFVEDEDPKDTVTTTWIGKQIWTVSMISNRVEDLLVLCEFNPRDLV